MTGKEEKNERKQAEDQIDLFSLLQFTNTGTKENKQKRTKMKSLLVMTA